ncbi:MAG: MBL fold metallo-hydrolase [Chitinivibrionales bacterium]|nr:MBL fold metallo-hydrolase [Chitinivibrionales bacterium]
MKYKVERFVTGPIETNTYVIYNIHQACLIIDPSSGCSEVLDYCKKHSLAVEAIVLTHAHFDHIMGIPEIVGEFPEVVVYVHRDDRLFLQDTQKNGAIMLGTTFSYRGALRELTEGDQTIGSFTMKIVHLPGHTPGGCALVFDDVCISGDVLFASSIGRSDFPGGDELALIEGIRTKLLKLPDNTIVYPGHGNRTTIGREKQSNPFIQ